MIPVEHQEGMQVLHYHNGQRYEPHHDFFADSYNTGPGTGGQRAATVLMYLTTPEEGGETVFPEGDRKVEGPEWSECARQGLAVKSVRGDAVMFFSLSPNGSEDETSLHGSCPTTQGDKWSATKWIRVGEIGEWCALSAMSRPQRGGCFGGARWGMCMQGRGGGDAGCIARREAGQAVSGPRPRLPGVGRRRGVPVQWTLHALLLPEGMQAVLAACPV